MSDPARVPAAGGPDTLLRDLHDRIARVLAPSDNGHPLHAPEIDGNAWAYVKDCPRHRLGVLRSANGSTGSRR